jgi:hypothetical protein
VDELDIREIESLRLDEELTVMRWRTERLVELGYALGEAARLALSTVDLHELERLIAKGCPLDLAVRIAV